MSVLLCRSNMVLFFHPTVFFLEKVHSLLHREVSSTYHWRHAKKATPWCILPGISSLSTFHAGLLSLFICCVHLGQSVLPSLVTSISPLPCKSWGLMNKLIIAFKSEVLFAITYLEAPVGPASTVSWNDGTSLSWVFCLCLNGQIFRCDDILV